MKDVDWILIHNSSCGNVLVNRARALSRVLKVGSKYQVGLTRDLRLGYDRIKTTSKIRRKKIAIVSHKEIQDDV